MKRGAWLIWEIMFCIAPCPLIHLIGVEEMISWVLEADIHQTGRRAAKIGFGRGRKMKAK